MYRLCSTVEILQLFFLVFISSLWGVGQPVTALKVTMWPYQSVVMLKPCLSEQVEGADVCVISSHWLLLEFISLKWISTSGNQNKNNAFKAIISDISLGISVWVFSIILKGGNVNISGCWHYICLTHNCYSLCSGACEGSMVNSQAPGVPQTPRLCAGCGGKIADRFLLFSMDRYWHTRCLKCSCCQAQLGDIGTTCYSKGGMILCRSDYIRWKGGKDGWKEGRGIWSYGF